MIFKFVAALVAVASFAPQASALEDHAIAVGVFNWIPTDRTREDYPELNPYKDHYVHKVEFTKEGNGKFRADVTLPEDLSAGKASVLTLREKSRNADLSEFRFEGAQGSLDCSVGESWTRTSCKVNFRNLPTSAADNAAFAQNKYKGTRKELPLRNMASLFASEPFGDLRLTDPEFQVEGSHQGNGHWKTKVQDSAGRWSNAPVFIDFDRGAFNIKGRAGLLGGFYYTDNNVEGGWSFTDEEYGWVKFTFHGNKFEGTWGTHDNPDTPKGRWIGER